MTTRDDIRRAAERLAVDPGDRDALAVVARAGRRAGVLGGVDVGDLVDACDVIDAWLRERPGDWRRGTHWETPWAEMWSPRASRDNIVVAIDGDDATLTACAATERTVPLADLTPDAVRAQLEDVWREMGWGGAQRPKQRPCSRCRGTGRVQGLNRGMTLLCPHCAGTGWPRARLELS